MLEKRRWSFVQFRENHTEKMREWCDFYFNYLKRYNAIFKCGNIRDKNITTHRCSQSCHYRSPKHKHPLAKTDCIKKKKNLPFLTIELKHFVLTHSNRSIWAYNKKVMKCDELTGFGSGIFWLDHWFQARSLLWDLGQHLKEHCSFDNSVWEEGKDNFTAIP